MKNKLFLLLIVLFASHLVFRIYEYRTDYLTPFDPDHWQQRYELSQWSTKPACENLDPHVNPHTCVWDDEWYAEHKDDPAINDLKKSGIGDDGLYTYAGWEYIHGHDPTTLNAELPPFGKYLIGLSEVLFNNQNIFALLSGIFALVAFYLLNTVLFKNKFLAFLPVVLLSFEPLFYTQLHITMLDLLYFGLLCMTFYFLLKKKYIGSAIFLGLLAATKSAASTFPLVIIVSVLYLLITKQYKAIKKYVFSLPAAGLVFLATYTQYFLLGHSLQEFLGVQKWIINFYAEGAKGSISAPWEMLFTGSYANWFGGQTTVTEWHIGWPIIFLISLVAIVLILTCFITSLVSEKHYGSMVKWLHGFSFLTIKPFSHLALTNKFTRNDKNNLLVLISLWVLVYLCFLSFVPIWPRYFLVILPFLYTITVWLIARKYTKHETS